MAFGTEVTGSAGVATGVKTRNVEFDRNVFVRTPNTSNAKLNEKNLGRGARERWRLRHNKEKEGPPEKISFETDTRAEFSQFLDNWATNTHEALNKPGGRAILDVLPHTRNMAEIIGIAENQALDKNALKQTINSVLNTAEGWIATKVLLDQEQALQAFAAGVTHEGGPNGDQPFSQVLRNYVDDEGVIHKFGRNAGQHVIRQWQLYGTVGLAGLGFVTLGVPGAAGGLALAAGAKIGTEAFDRGQVTTQRACAEALQFIQNNEGLKAYMKSAVGMDADDFVIQRGRIRHNPNIRPEDRGSRVDRRGFLDGLMKNTVTRQKYYRDLHVPLDQQDAQPERFILSRSGRFERTGDRIHSDTVDIWQNLRRAQTAERRRLGPENPPTENERRAALLQDANGRGADSPLNGRNYPKGVEPPRFRPENVLDENLDIWGQAKHPDDGSTFTPNIIAPATFRVEEGVSPQITNPLERTRSDWYGRAPAERVFFLGTEAVPFVSPTAPAGEQPAYTLQRRGEVHPTAPDATIHAKDSLGRKLYEYAYNGTQRIEIPAATAEERIFFITDHGEQVPLNDPRIDRLPSVVGNAYEFNGNPIDPNNLFYIPNQQAGLPIPFGALRGVSTDPADASAPHNFIYDPANRPFPAVEVAENKFYLINPGANPSSMENHPEQNTLIENDFHRDNWLIPPLEAFDPTDPRQPGRYERGQQAFLYGRDFPQSRLAVLDRLVRNGALEQGVTIDELQTFLQGGTIPPDRVQVVNGILARTSTVGRRSNRRPRTPLRRLLSGMPTEAQRRWDERMRLRDIQQFDESNFRARDNQGRSPADMRFGISDPDILRTLDTILLTPPDFAGNMTDIEATGRDQWGQLPNDPFFCRANRTNFAYTDAAGVAQPPANLNERIDFSIMAIDTWGQRPTYFDAQGNDTGIPNPFFTVQNEQEVAERQQGANGDLELWIKAREIAMGNITEDLVRKLRKFPARNRSVIQAKRAARRENGPNLQARQERAGQDKPTYQEAQKILKSRVDDLEKHKKATDELTKATSDLPDYVRKKFGTSFYTGTLTPGVLADDLTAATAAISRLEEILTQQSAGDITILGSGTIPAIYDREAKLSVDQRAAEDKVHADNQPPTGSSETDAQYEAREKRIEKELARVQRDFDSREQPIERDRKTIQDTIDAIKKLQKTIEDQTKALQADGAITKARDEALSPQGKDQTATNDLIAGLASDPTWQTASLTELLTRINAENTGDPNFGWPAYENNDPENQKILLYTMVRGRILSDPSVIAAQTAAAAVAGATPASIQSAVDASAAAIDTPDLRADILSQLLRQTDRQIRRITNLETTAASDPELIKENELLDITDAAMGRQGIIFGSTAGFMSRINDTVPLDGNAPRTVASLSANEREAITEAQIGLAIPDETPIYVLNIYDEIFGWRGRHDQKAFLKAIFDAFPPTELVRVLHTNAPETIPPLRADIEGFGADLHDRITELQISRSALRQMEVAVLDHLEESSLALYDGPDLSIDPAEAARIRRVNLGLPVSGY